jgi:hypothetical protein
MATETSFELKGGPAADAALGDTEALFKAKAFEKGMRDSVRPIVKAAKRYIDDDTGNLRKSIGTKLVQYPDAWVVIVDAFNRRGGFHGHNVEFGHEASGWYQGADEPVPAHPFLAPAIAAERMNVERNFEQSVVKQVEKAFLGK